MQTGEKLVARAKPPTEQAETKDLAPLPVWREEFHRAILDSALDCIITMDADGRVREFNPAAERTFGYTRDEAIGKELAELIIPRGLRERHRAGLAKYLKTGEGPVIGRRIEISGLRKDGKEILLELAINAIKIDGSPIFTAYLRDITDRTRAEAMSRRLAAIIEYSEDAIISTDLNGVIRSWNNAGERLFGYTASEVVGKPVTVLIPTERHDEEPRILERIRRGEPVDHYETIRRHKSGAYLNISLTVSPIKDESGKVVGASKIARNITARVRADRRRAAQYAVANLLSGSRLLSEVGEEIIRAIAATGSWVAGTIWLCENDCETLHAAAWHGGGSRLEAFAQKTRAWVVEKGVGLPGRVVNSGKAAWITDIAQDTNFPRAAAAAAAGLRGAFAFPLSAYGDMKGVLELFSPGLAEPDEDLLQLVEALGSQIGLFIHRQQIEEELQEQKENAEAANAAKDHFLASLSHELRTPLNPVLIWAGGTLKQPDLPPDMAEGLEMVCRNIELEARLIDDLLDLTRITRGKLQLHLRRCDAHELLQHALEIVRSEAAVRRLNLDVHLDATDHHIFVDAPRVQQVFWNVLRNAYKFTPDRGTVSVRTRNSADQLIVEITDNGVGIEPQYLDKIFEAFEQVGTRREGLGLGLAISKAIVDMHGGKIRAQSEGLGHGATFVIELPLGSAA